MAQEKYYLFKHKKAKDWVCAKNENHLAEIVRLHEYINKSVLSYKN